MGFVCDLMKAGSVGVVETAVEHVGLFSVARKAGAQRFIIDARASNRHLLSPPSGPLLTREGLFHVEFHGALEGLWVRPMSRTHFIKCAFLDGSRRFLNFPLFSHPKLVTLEKLSTKTTDVLMSHNLTTRPMGFSWAMFFLSGFHGPLHARRRC